MSKTHHIYKPVAKEKNGLTEAKIEEAPSNDCLPNMNNPVCFSICGLLACTVGFAGYVFQSASITSLERRFQLKSSQSAILPIISDAVGVCTMLFIVHFGNSRHRPRVISVLLTLTGFGFMLYSVPHFLHGMPPILKSHVVAANLNSTAYQTDISEGLCVSGGPAGVTEETCSTKDQDESGALYGQAIWLFIGAAVASLITSFYPLYIIHIDDGVEKKKLPIYMGVLFAAFAVGSLLGFGMASWCLRIPAYLTDPEYNKITMYDPRFLGAWWLGFLILGVLEIMFAIPIFFFPRYLPKPKMEETEATDDEGLTEVMLKSIKFDVAQENSDDGFAKGLLKSIWRVLSNPTLAACFLCYILLSVYYGGFSVFGPKYFQFQFNVNPYTTAMILAVIMLPPGIFGNLVGGILVRVFGKTRVNIATIVLVLGVTMMLIEPLGLIFGCSNENIAGLTVDYEQNVDSELELPNLDGGCNTGCGCKDDYDPVCGSDGVTYVTSCFAGCTDVGQAEIDGISSMIYLNCSCVSPGAESSLLMANESVSEVIDQYAVKGSCKGDTRCEYVIPYLVWVLAIMTLGTVIANPITILQIRSVELRDRSICIAVGNILSKLFGLMPGPIIFGALIDSSCLFFQSTCGVTGNCYIYDIVRFRFTYIGLFNVLRIAGTLFLLVAFISVKLGWDVKKTDQKESNEKPEEKQPIKLETTV